MALADALDIMADKLPKKFKAADVAALINSGCDPGKDLRDFLFPDDPPDAKVENKPVSYKLKPHLSNPVRLGDKTLRLRTAERKGDRALEYYVEKIT